MSWMVTAVVMYPCILTKATVIHRQVLVALPVLSGLCVGQGTSLTLTLKPFSVTHCARTALCLITFSCVSDSLVNSLLSLHVGCSDWSLIFNECV